MASPPCQLRAGRAHLAILAVAAGLTIPVSGCSEVLGLESPTIRKDARDGGLHDGGPEARGCSGEEIACGEVCVDVATSDAHCGRCNHPCWGQGCQGGVCQPMDRVTELVSPSPLAARGGGVAWEDLDPHTVQVQVGFVGPDDRPCRGTACSADPPGQGVTARCLTWRGDQLYIGTGQGFLRVRPPFGTDLSGAAPVLAGTHPTGDCVVEGSTLYWLEYLPGAIGRSVDGETAESVVTSTSPLSAPTVAGGKVFFVFAPTEPGAGVFMVTPGTTCVADQCTRLFPGLQPLRQVALGDGSLAMMVPRLGLPNAILRASTEHPCDGGLACGAVVGEAARPTAGVLRTDGAMLYWASKGEVLRAPADGLPCPSNCGPVLTGLEEILDIAVDERFVYAAARPANSEALRRARIVRVPK